MTERRGRPVAVVLRALGLGDLLTAVPALRALRRGLHGHHLVLLTPDHFSGLVRHADLADRVVPLTGKSSLPSSMPPLPGVCAVAVNLHGRGPSSHRLLMSTSPSRLIAFACPGLFVDGPPWRAGEHEVLRWVRLVTDAGFPARATELSIAPPDRPLGRLADGTTILHPGAAAPARRWPPRRWADLAAVVDRVDGHDVIVTAGPGERALAEQIVTGAGLPPSRVVGVDDVLDLLAVVHHGERLVCGDTGVAHVATAVGTPSVVLFGPTPPHEWGPPASPRHRPLWRGGRGDPHAPDTDEGLLGISVEDVREALSSLPTRATGVCGMTARPSG